MNPTFLVLALLSSSLPAASPVATLRVQGEDSTFAVKVTEDPSVGYQISIDCTEQCSKAVHYSETIGDTPLGIFSRDQNDLIFSTWSGGSAYRVVVWSVAGGVVSKVAELSSRGRPDFISGPDGAPMIQTYDTDRGTAPLHRVLWTFTNNRFVRFEPNGR